MPLTSRRAALQATLAGLSATQLRATAAVSSPPDPNTRTPLNYGRGFEGQRKADLGNGTFLNPIVPGDHPDPTILKDGENYYMTFSSFLSYPGVILWHSRDLVNWTPLGPALTRFIGNVWAMDLVKHAGRYYIYIPASSPERSSIYVIHGDNIRGPWSEPIDLNVPGCIDPGHAVGEDGKRYLFFNGVKRIQLSDDGLSTVGPLEQVYTPWHFPDSWTVEMFAPEGPKIFRRDGWYYLVTAVGGTAGPPTSHMVTAARSRSIHGPWENCPHNPIVHTRTAEEPWWSRGHATVVEGPSGDWWMVYHGYENGFRTLGRQTLLEPIEWSPDGWFHAKGGNLSAPLAKPRGGTDDGSGFPLSDDFSTNKLGIQWSFFAPDANESQRLRYDNDSRLRGSLLLEGKGSSLADCSPLTCIVGDRSYEATVSLEISGAAHGGLALFYNNRAFVGVGFTRDEMLTYNYSQEQRWLRQKSAANPIHLKLTNRSNVVTFHYSPDGKIWTQHPWTLEVSGYHQNVFGDFLSLRLALFSAGQGTVRARNFTYRSLES
jgi:xylan 1,4-beta-xylosidase